MALLQHDGFDHYGTTSLSTATSVSSLQWVSSGYVLPTQTVTATTSYGKSTGSLGLGLTASTTDSVWLKKSIKPEAAFATGAAYTPTIRVGFGFALRFALAPVGNLQFARLAGVNVSIGSDWFVYVDGVNTNYQCELNIWNFPELFFDIAASKFQLWMADTLIYEKAVANPVLDFWEIRSQYTSGGTAHICMHVDDFYLIDGTGQYNTDRIGKTITLTRYPTADAGVAMTPDTGAANFSRVNQATADADTSYVASNKSGTTDLYTNTAAFEVVDDGAIRAITIAPNARMVEPDSLSLTAVIKVDDAEAVGYRMKLKASTYTSQKHIFEVSPKTNAPWTPTEALNVKFGQRLLPKPT